jgi:3',5'-cyclic AMP phosphodiesterase CpdA
LAPDAVFVGAGDIGNCAQGNPEATARLLDRIPGTVFTLGDNAYPSATAEQLANCYGPTWGRHLGRTRSTPGNHEWEVSAGAPYFAYFGANGAGPSGRGYYSFELGAWHIVSLNANIAAGPGSPQLEWLRSDLAAHPASCTLAYWHHPLFSSGGNGNTPNMRDVWRILDGADADVVLSGHDHTYERFAPQTADGSFDARGIRSFVVGTGGAPLYGMPMMRSNSEVRENRTWGVLKLTLHASSYDWEFVPVDGQLFRDFGNAECVSPL